ncbi:hypothetical protein SASPL_136157 [Salvia splendens]|uniref:Uncharacterized protein n=1 Tax=Salvia splendens TaxID=180675 RepID=A0A8X8X1H3_SALSN|nr:hypothetical protein SASPL_136157 [Salvia splendens]
MAVSRRKGKLIFALTVSLLLADLSYFPRLCCAVLAPPESDPSVNSNSAIETDIKNDIPFKQNDNPSSETCVDHDLVSKQQLQLVKLQELVQNLTQLVDRLESRLSDDLGSIKMHSLSSHDGEIIGVEETKEEDSLPGKGEMKGGGGMKSGPMLVTKFNTFWAERFQFVSAVKLISNPTCVNVLPNKDFEGLSKYFLLLGMIGKLYLFLRSGEVALEFEAFPEVEKPSPISAIASYLSFHKNETLIVTGHGNGVIVMHRVGRRLVAMNGARFMWSELGDTGAGSLDLSTMKLKETECEALNSSVAKSYVFYAMDQSKAYGLTGEVDLVQTSLLGDVMNFKCRVRSKRKLDMDEPMALQAIKGYLLVANKDKVYVYNVSSQHYVRAGRLRLLFSAGLDEIIAPFLNQQQGDDVNMEKKLGVPLITSDHEKLVIISLGNGYVAMYRSNLPVFKNEFNSILWTCPVLFFILFLFGAWQCFANKEALTSWGPDDPFTSASVTSGAPPLGSATGDRSFPDSSRKSEIMELRGGSGLRGSSRYVSPPRYSGGGPNPYRPGGADTDSRPAPNHYRPSNTDTDSRPTANHYRPSPDTDARSSPVDPRFRTAELKYRGSNVEASAVPKRRENNTCISSQVVDDSN